MEGLRAWAAQLDFSRLIDMALLACACLLCITFHEMCHGLTALALGDPTAKRAGRLTLNPLKHVDPIGLVMLAVARVGWAKPVPINPRYFKNRRLGMAVTALAGPLSNLLLAAAATVLYAVSWFYLHWQKVQWLSYAVDFFLYTVHVSVGLAAFNLLPVPPLDGSKVLFAFLPEPWYWKLLRYERYGVVAMVVLLMTGALDVPLAFLRGGLLELMDPIAEWTVGLLNAIHF